MKEINKNQKHIIKYFITIVIALIMCISLTGCKKGTEAIDTEFSLEKFSNVVLDTATEVYFGTKEEYASKLENLQFVAIDQGETDNIRVYSDNTIYYVVNETNGKIIAPSVLDKIFGRYESLKTVVFNDNFDTSNVTSMISLFFQCTSLESIDLSCFNTSNNTSMYAMFAYCDKLTSVNLSSFDTKNVTDMSYVFTYCKSLQSIDVTNFDTSKATTMYGLFYECSELKEIDVSHFDTSNVKDISYMFAICSSLKNIDVSNFNTASVTTMSGVFSECTELTLIDITSFDTANVDTIDYMFDGCTKLTTIYVSDKFVTDKVEISEDMFRNCPSLIGEMGTMFDSEKVDITYAKFDGGASDIGYFSHKK